MLKMCTMAVPMAAAAGAVLSTARRGHALLRRAPTVLLCRRQGGFNACRRAVHAAKCAPNTPEKTGRSEQFARREVACVEARGDGHLDVERALHDFANALGSSPTHEFIEALDTLCAVLQSSAGRAHQAPAEEALMLSDRLIAARVPELSPTQLGRLVRALACGALAPERTVGACARRIRELVRCPALAADAVQEMNALLPHLAAASARPVFAAVVEAISSTDKPEADTMIAQLPASSLGQLARVLVEWRASQRQQDFRQRDFAERVLLLIFARARRPARLRALVELASERAGVESGDKSAGTSEASPLVHLLRAACLVEPRPPGGGGGVAAGIGAGPLFPATRPSDFNRTREMRVESSAFVRAALRWTSDSERLRSLEPRTLGALLESSVHVAGAADRQARDRLGRELKARERTGRLPGSVLISSMWLAAHAAHFGWIVDAAVRRAIDELRDAAALRAAAEGRTLQPHRTLRYGRAEHGIADGRRGGSRGDDGGHAGVLAGGGEARQLPSQPGAALARARAVLTPQEVQQLAVSYVRRRLAQQSFRGQFVPAERRLEDEFFEELAEAVVASPDWAGQLDPSKSADLLVAMTRIGLGSLPALHALLARVVLADGGLRAAELSEAQLANLVWALGKTATVQLSWLAHPLPDSGAALAAKARVGSSQLEASAMPAPATTAAAPPAAQQPARRFDAQLGNRMESVLSSQRGASWLWSELTQVASERLTEPKSSTAEAARALWGIAQAGRYLVQPLRALVSHVVRRLETLAAPRTDDDRENRNGPDRAAAAAAAAAPRDAAAAGAGARRAAAGGYVPPFFQVVAGSAGAAQPGGDGGAHGETAGTAQPDFWGGHPGGAGTVQAGAQLGPSITSVEQRRAWVGWNLTTESQLFLALAAIELEAPSALPPIQPATWRTLERAHEASVGRGTPFISDLQREVCAMLDTLGLAYAPEQEVSIPLRTAGVSLKYVVDARLVGLPVIIEVHGAPHMLFGSTLSYASQKHRLLRMHGYKVVEIFAHRWNAHRGSHEQLALHLADTLANEAGVLVQHTVGL